MKKQKELDLEVETIGEPNVAALPEAEQHTFFETLLNRITELKAENDKKQEAADDSKK